MYMAETNKVYIVQGDTLVPHEQFWGATPKYEMLESDKVGVHKYWVLLIVWLYFAHISVFQCNVPLLLSLTKNLSALVQRKILINFFVAPFLWVVTFLERLENLLIDKFR